MVRDWKISVVGDAGWQERVRRFAHSLFFIVLNECL